MPRSQPRILITWWGSLANGGETIGDLHAVCRVARLTKASGLSCEIASKCHYRPLQSLDVAIVDWRSVSLSARDTLIFVCGPIIGESAEFQELFARFAPSRKVGIGVSLLPATSPSSWNPFDVVLARDGASDPVGDIAFGMFPLQSYERPSRPSIGVCYRGHQREYGPDACLHESAEQMGNALAEATGWNIVHLDTKLHGIPDRDDHIFNAFSGCDAVVSTRLHGALLPIALGKPTVAIDQIRGGTGKVTAVLNNVPWPLLVRADAPPSSYELRNIAATVTADASMKCLLEGARASLDRMIAVAESRITQVLTL